MVLEGKNPKKSSQSLKAETKTCKISQLWFVLGNDRSSTTDTTERTGKCITACFGFEV